MQSLHSAWCVLWVLVAMSWQPGLVGQNLAPVLILVALLMIVSEVAFSGRIGGDPVLFMALLFFPIFVIFKYSGEGANEIGDYAKNLVIFIVGAGCMIVGKRRFDSVLICKSYLWILAICSASGVITYVVYGLSLADRLPYFSFEIKHYAAVADMYFPLTAVYEQRYTIGSYRFVRMIGIFREPGVYQAFLCVAIVLSGFVYRGWRLFLLVVICVSGVLCTMSTAGYVGLFISLPILIYCVYGRASLPYMVFFLISVSPLLMQVMNLESVGINDKLSGESGADRLAVIDELERHFWNSGLFGISGYGEEKIESMTGTLPLFYLSYGLLGFFLSLIPFLYLLWRGRLGKVHLAFVPLFVAAMTSQPLWGTLPFFAVFYFVSVLNETLSINGNAA